MPNGPPPITRLTLPTCHAHYPDGPERADCVWTPMAKSKIDHRSLLVTAPGRSLSSPRAPVGRALCIHREHASRTCGSRRDHTLSASSFYRQYAVASGGIRSDVVEPPPLCRKRRVTPRKGDAFRHGGGAAADASKSDAPRDLISMHLL